MALMVSVSGIRGIFGSDLTPENLVTYTASFGTWLKGGRVVVGRDTRVTGPICEEIVVATLQSCGCDVIRVGVVPTPTVGLAVRHHQARGGIILTASHNPAQWNALKLLNDHGLFLDKQEGEAVIRIADQKQYKFRDYQNLGLCQVDEAAIDRHIEAILELPYIHPEKIRGAGFKVAVDAVNGAGSVALPRLLSQLGVEVHPIHCTPNGLFPHNPEPLPENLTDLCRKVASDTFDLGLATDPDADRLAVVDENGSLWGEEYTQVAAFDFMLAREPGDTATNLSSSRAASDISEKYGKKCHRSAVGEINVVKKMEETGAVIAGEGNGGVINPDLHKGRDALTGSAMILQLLAEREMSASIYRSELPDYVITKQKYDLNQLGVEADELIDIMASIWAPIDPDRTDGIKVDLEEGWVHVRKSNTEPIVRVYCEAGSIEAAQRLEEKVMGPVQKQIMKQAKKSKGEA